MILTGENRRTHRKKTCPNANLSTINPTRTDPGANWCLRGDRPATNRLSHDTSHDSLMTLPHIGQCKEFQLRRDNGWQIQLRQRTDNIYIKRQFKKIYGLAVVITKSCLVTSAYRPTDWHERRQVSCSFVQSELQRFTRELQNQVQAGNSLCKAKITHLLCEKKSYVKPTLGGSEICLSVVRLMSQQMSVAEIFRKK
jgi:hypothetical protein